MFQIIHEDVIASKAFQLLHLFSDDNIIATVVDVVGSHTSHHFHLLQNLKVKAFFALLKVERIQSSNWKRAYTNVSSLSRSVGLVQAATGLFLEDVS